MLNYYPQTLRAILPVDSMPAQSSLALGLAAALHRHYNSLLPHCCCSPTCFSLPGCFRLCVRSLRSEQLVLCMLARCRSSCSRVEILGRVCSLLVVGHVLLVARTAVIVHATKQLGHAYIQEGGDRRINHPPLQACTREHSI